MSELLKFIESHLFTSVILACIIAELLNSIITGFYIMITKIFAKDK